MLKRDLLRERGSNLLLLLHDAFQPVAGRENA